ncbi:protein adenylyltransferase SelO [Undibacterium flavidum]|uniref:Protein nucleotidyltransferase YdiU n=1 Tax=Undibacterium flavidum TaxID=2762297 RepID=A0ABR6YFK4_9BURK|nr:YdiU family protein [Undibacterium flavidum]MBC3875355.1 YdiU family protein [Undibacterium flavidum]
MNQPDSPVHKPLHFQNCFAELGSAFFTPQHPTPLKSPYLIAVSPEMLSEFGISDEQIREPELIEVFSGNRVHSSSAPLATVYSGHQFGVWAGQLGDGRAILLGDLATRQDNIRHEIQLKGAGMTPYSRMGDGRAVLRSSVREFLCSEAMAGLGIPTSRALCITGSDQYTMREMPEKTAVVTRTAPSFVRFGSFEHWYYKEKPEQLQQLADFVIQHYYPHLQNTENPYPALLKEVVIKTAQLVAHWQAVGFMHGVLNTDNMSILGLTLDYGPFGFMDGFDPAHICNHSDNQGRYSYQMQPRIGQWNCHALAQALLPLIGDVETTQEALSPYVDHYEAHYHKLMQQKFGLLDQMPGDDELFAAYLDLMASTRTDFTLAFRNLSQVERQPSPNDNALRDLFADRASLDIWLQTYRSRLQQGNSIDAERQIRMNQINPKYVLRNYLAQQAIEKAEQKDFSEIEKLLKILTNPFAEQPEFKEYAQLPPDWAGQLSVSCSS